MTRLMINRSSLLLISLSFCWNALGFVVPAAPFAARQPSVGALSFMAPIAVDSSMALSSQATVVSGSLSAISAVELGGFPALLMLLFTVIGLKIRTDPILVGALQHFAAGILLSTIAIELLPEMMNAKGLEENLASGVGFFMGVAVLIGLGVLLPQEQDDNGQEGAGEEKQAVEALESSQEHSPLCQSLRNRQQSFKSEAFCCACATERALEAELLPMNAIRSEEGSTLDDEQSSSASPSDVTGAMNLEETLSEKTSVDSFPTALVTAIAIDSALDGLLIGIAIAAGPSTGPMLSASLSVEMSFLGLTLAAALYGQSLSQSLPAAVLGPAVLLLGAFAGGALATTLANSPVLLAGLLGFGTSSLLFMVAEELLLEAHEEGEHVWWSDLQLYTGFFASILASKFVLAA